MHVCVWRGMIVQSGLLIGVFVIGVFPYRWKSPKNVWGKKPFIGGMSLI